MGRQRRGTDGQAAPGIRTASAAGARVPPSPGPGRSPDGPQWRALQTGLDGELVLPGDAGYEAGRLPRNLLYAEQAHPEAIAYCTGPDDVAQCVRFTRRYGLRLAVRGGGHCYGAWSSRAPLVVDLSRMTGVRIDGEGHAEIRAGTPLITVYEELARHGVTVPAGSCPTVGLAGLALGGGHGVVSRSYGLTCDSLAGAEVVLPDGRTVYCDEQTEPDLLWALRGAGNGNFGVVTSLRMRTHPATDLTEFRASWPYRDAGTALEHWQDWAFDAPDNLWSHFLLEAPRDSPTADVGGFLLGGGGEDEANRWLDGLLAVTGPASARQVTHRSYLATVRSNAGGETVLARLDEQRFAFTAASQFFDRRLGPQAIRDTLAVLRRVPDGVSAAISFNVLGGAVNRVPADATAFVHRNSRLLAQYYASWPAGGPAEAAVRWVGQVREALRPYTSGHAYQNYRDPELTDWRQAYYGANLPRLERLRVHYDPDRLLDFPQAL
ncbi:FAD-binding oxidoreductase [Kitasatospora sp. NPDC057223]|uniref:FAD-binding oxidoreductase n=1 Tax=Kitasatospora sp. NPDC057223 TaxID=3346055 RepID=UPI00363435C8